MAKVKHKRTIVTAHLPTTVDLTKRNSGNSLQFEVRSGEDLLGTLYMGRGSVQWWPGGNKKNALEKSWTAFAKMLSEHM
jgi:hypothetical protein